MKKKMVKLLTAVLTCGMLLMGTACGKQTVEFDRNSDYETIAEQAKGQTVTFYGWGGNDLLNKWLDTEVAPLLKEKYEITLERVPMDIDQILNKLSGEKQAGREVGSVDIIWLNGENFYSAKENGLLYGSFTEYLPNYAAYVDENDPESSVDFGFPIEGYEAPYGKAQLVLINDSARTPETPKNAEELLEFAKKYKGKVTYPAPPDFTGSAFVRNLIYDIVGYEKFEEIPATKEAVRELIAPAVDYMKELNPYLWNEGKSFPATLAQLDNMYADGEVVMTVCYEPYLIAAHIENGTFPDTSRSFTLDNGTIGNSNYIAIAANSGSKQGAIVAINEILSPKLQASKYGQVKLQPAISYDKLNDSEKELFDSIDIGKGVIAPKELLQKRLPEIPAQFVPIIEEIWLEEVVGK